MTSLKNKTILIVDDDAAMIRAVNKVLTGEGATVFTALAAAEAIETMTRREKRMDLVITDLRMPYVNGMTLIYAVHEIFPLVPIIVMTAFGSPELRAECIRQGAVEFLEKPLSASRLLATIERVFAAGYMVNRHSKTSAAASGTQTPVKG